MKQMLCAAMALLLAGCAAKPTQSTSTPAATQTPEAAVTPAPEVTETWPC